MSVQDDLTPYKLIIVNVGKDPNGPPWAQPAQAVTFLKSGVGDTVRFQSPQEFTVEFKGATPFEWATQSGTDEGGGVFRAIGTVQPDALEPGVQEKHFGYNLTVDGVTVDPDVVVKKDPKDT